MIDHDTFKDIPVPYGDPLPRPTQVVTVYSEMYILSLRRIKRENDLVRNIDIFTHPDVIKLPKWVREMAGKVEADQIFNENL